VIKRLLILTTIIALNPLFMTVSDAESDSSEPSLASEAAVMIDAETGDILYEKNANAPMYPASLTKIATAIFAIETADLDDTVTVSEKARNTGGSSVYLEEGEQVTLKKLIQGLLINSGNDAGVVIAEHVSGSVGQFASDMNEYLQKRVGIQNTHFENPHGLFDSDHMTTAEDMAKITQYAIRNETFRDIFGTIELEWNGESWDTTLVSHHKLMRQEPDITGGKTGFVDQSGHTLATTAQKDDLNLIVITLNAKLKKASYEDTIDLLDYGFANFEQSAIDKGTIFEAGNEKYKTAHHLTYTHKINEEVHQDISDEGVLKLRKQNGEVISSFQLEKPGKKKVSETTENDVKEDSILGSTLFMTVIPIIVVMIGIIGVVYRRKRKQEKRIFT